MILVDRYTIRWAVSHLMLGLCVLATLLGAGLLLTILGFVLAKGAGSLTWSFFTEVPKPAGLAGGGVANALVGTLILVALASLFAFPLGVAGGIYLSEVASPRLAMAIRFVVDVLTGVPSIVVGVFFFALVVRRMGHFSALAGGLALAFIMLPLVVITTQEALQLVPHSLREAAWALGVRRWRTVVSVVVKAGRRVIITGALLAVARAAGETAPLLFTAFGNAHWNLNVTQPMAALPHTIFVYAVAPWEDWHGKAWAASFLLVMVVLAISAAARALVGGRRF